MTISASDRLHGRAGLATSPVTWALAAAGVLALAVAFVALTQARPAYDAMGFLVWGRQALHANLNLTGAPSWKPLPFLATLPYALAGPKGQEWLWTVTAAAGAVAAVILAARLAYRLSGDRTGGRTGGGTGGGTGDRTAERRWARLLGALLAAYGVGFMAGFLHLALIANSDPLIVALALGAIDCHISRSHRAALVLLWLAALGRPEAWPFLLLYVAWLWRSEPRARRLAVAAVVSMFALWFIVPELAGSSWQRGSQLALGQATAIHGDKLTGVFDRLRTLAPLPIQLAALASVAIGVVTRDRRILALTAMILLWSAVEVAFALHGYSATPRYLIEPGALMMVVAGIGLATVLSSPLRPVTAAGLVALVVLAVALVPSNRTALRYDHGLISQAHTDARVLDRLTAVVSSDGGPRRLLACGQPVTTLTYQSTLAWELGLNVGDVGYPAAVRGRHPEVLLEPHGGAWSVRALHSAAADARTCHRLDRPA